LRGQGGNARSAKMGEGGAKGERKTGKVKKKKNNGTLEKSTARKTNDGTRQKTGCDIEGVSGKCGGGPEGEVPETKTKHRSLSRKQG